MAVNGNRAPPGFILHALRDLAKLEARPLCLTDITYEWCSAIYENREYIEGWEILLPVCLELGFRHLDPRQSWIPATLARAEHHRGLVDVIFKSQKSEVVADFLQALTMQPSLLEQAGEMIDICTGHLLDLHILVPFSPRLRKLVIRFVEIAGDEGFEGAGVEKLIELLDRLQVTVKEMDENCRWTLLLLHVIRSSEGAQCLSDWYWELLVELTIWDSWWLKFGDNDALQIAKSLNDAEEWGKLECCIGIMWMSSRSGGTTEEDLGYSTLLLLRQRPGATQKLEQWMEQWSKRHRWMGVPVSFQRILTQAHEAAQRQDAP